MAAKTVVLGPDEGTALWMLDGLYEVKATGDETGGAMTVMQMTIPPGAGPPPHTHSGAEAVYVLEGSVRFHIGDETVEAEPGSFLHFPAGTLETFDPTGDGPVRLLIIYTPGGVDEMFVELGEPAAVREVPPRSESPPDIERLVAITARYGVDMHLPDE